MRLRRLVLTLIVALGATLAIDRMIQRIVTPLPPPIAGQPVDVECAAGSVAVTEAGGEENPDLVFVHSTYLGASAHEFADLAESIDGPYHQVLIDLPGFGRSEARYPPISRAQLIDAIATVCEERTDTPTVIASGQAVPLVLEAAEQTRIGRLIAIGPRTGRIRARPLLASMIEFPVLGAIVRLVLFSRGSIRSHLATVFECHPASVPSDHLESAWACAHAPWTNPGAAAVLGGDLDGLDPLETCVADTAPELAFVVGEQARYPTVDDVRTAAAASDAPVSVVTGSGAFPHIMAPSAVATHLMEAELLDPLTQTS